MREKLEFFRDNLKKEDFKILSDKTRVSVSTVKRYFDGNIPDNIAGDIILEKLLEFAKEIIEKRTTEVKDILETI